MGAQGTEGTFSCSEWDTGAEDSGWEKHVWVVFVCQLIEFEGLWYRPHQVKLNFQSEKETQEKQFPLPLKLWQHFSPKGLG